MGCKTQIVSQEAHDGRKSKLETKLSLCPAPEFLPPGWPLHVNVPDMLRKSTSDPPKLPKQRQLRPDPPLTLLNIQRLDRIDTRSLKSGDQASGECRTRQQDQGQCKRCQIEGAHAVQLSLNQAGGYRRARHAGQRSEGHDPRPLGQNVCHYDTTGCTERDPDADLAPALLNVRRASPRKRSSPRAGGPRLPGLCPAGRGPPQHL